MNNDIFRANDIRGIAETDLNSQAVELIAKAYGTYLQKHHAKKVAVGADVRKSSERIKSEMIQALLSTGCDVVDIGYVPSPVGYFTAFQTNVDAVAVVTASHNPAEYNGFKLGLGTHSLFGEEIQEIRTLAENQSFVQGSGSLESFNANEAYCNWMKEHFSFTSKPKIAIDSANATGAIFASQLFADLGCEVYSIYDEVDGNFPNHHPDPTIDSNMVSLRKLVLEKGAKLGIGFDGDSDRIGILDEKGRLISGDLLTALFARSVLKNKPESPIIFEVKSSQALEDEIIRLGGKPIMGKVGHSFLKQKMLELNAPLAGEVSGHIFFADRYFGYDDAIYAGIRMIEILEESGKKLSELYDSLPKFFATPEIRVDCGDDQNKREVTQKAVDYFKKHEKVLDIDGVRILYPDGWGLVRASNTQPTLVTRFEASSEERLIEIRDGILGKLNEFGNIQIDAH